MQKLKDLKIAEFGVEHPKEFVEGAECLPMEVTPDADQVCFLIISRKGENVMFIIILYFSGWNLVLTLNNYLFSKSFDSL